MAKLTFQSKHFLLLICYATYFPIYKVVRWILENQKQKKNKESLQKKARERYQGLSEQKQKQKTRT